MTTRDRTTTRSETRRATFGAGARARAAAYSLASSWTGRAATSRVTDSGLPRLVTSGTHRTRVSEMRASAARRGRPAVHPRLAVHAAPTGPAADFPRSARRRRGPSLLVRRLSPNRSG